MIRRLLIVFGSLRLPILLFAVPYALLWTRTSESGGWMMVLAHATLTLFGFMGVDASLLKRGREPRLTLKRNSEYFDLRVIEVGRAFLGLIALIAGFALLFIQWKLGAIALVALVLMELGTDGYSERWRRTRFAWAEWILPLALLIAPALAIAASAKSRLARLNTEYQAAVETAGSPQTEAAVNPRMIEDAHARVESLAVQIDAIRLMPHWVMAATILGAIALAAFVLLCLRRDEMIDRGDQLRTTPAAFGRGFSGFVLALMFIALLILASLGVHELWFTWHYAAIAGIGVMLTIWAAAANHDDLGVGVWYLAHLALVMTLTLTMV